MIKKCSKCSAEKDVEEFGRRKQSVDGLHIWCRKCVAEYDKKWYNANKDEVKPVKYARTKAWKAERVREFNGRFKSGPCADCKGRFHPAAMQFDHLLDKEFNIGDKKSAYSMERLEVEIAKCELVCANCHAVRTHKRIVDAPIS